METEKAPLQIIWKAWGHEEVMVNEPEYCWKRLVLKPGRISSNHYHRRKKETFVVEKGHVHLQVQRKNVLRKYELGPGDTVTINPGHPHEFWLEKEATEPCIISEISTHHSEDDVIRTSESREL